MRLLTFATKEEWSTYHHKFLAAIPPALERFHRRIARHDLVADGTVESLGPIGKWFELEVRHPEPAPNVPLPPWWDPVLPWAGTGTPDDSDLTRDQVILIDEMHSYFADVLIRAYPEAKWVIFKGERREDRRGQTLLQLGDKKWPVQTAAFVYKAAVRSVRDGESWPPGGFVGKAAVELGR